MTIRELVDELKEYDGDREILVEDDEGSLREIRVKCGAASPWGLARPYLFGPSFLPHTPRRTPVRWSWRSTA